MTEFLIYDLKVAALMVVFYMFYRLMLARETFHRVNRLVLLTTAVASFVLPLCVITLHETVAMAKPRANIEVGALMAEAEATQVPLWQKVMPILFVTGVVLTLAHTLWSLFRILKLIRSSERHPQQDGTTICVVSNPDLSPFSWMHYIVMNRSDYETCDPAILTHERGHIRLHHSWDLLLVDTLTALQWFNPAMWMLRQDLRAIHEYEADGEVLSQGINARQYQYLLITKAAGIGGYSLANGISHSTLKNRITMMLHKESKSSHLLKLLALIPIVGITLALNARTVTDYVYDEPQKQQPVKKGKKAGTIKVNGQEIKVVEQDDIVTMEGEADRDLTPDIQKPESVEMPNGMAVDAQEKVFDVVEQMPQYPGGPGALFKFLSENVRYPEEAEKQNIEGRVILTFVVGKDGSIRNTKVVKSVDPLLDAEALRVISAMPNWTPGRQNGKPVAVKYTVPVGFRLDDADTEGELVKSTGSDTSKPTAIHISGTTENLLIIVDGKEMSAEKMRRIDPKTIDRIEVLKDEDAIKRYGEKAKEGVILITTKKE